MFFDVFRWWLALLFIGLLATPLTTWLFRFLPGRGLAWSKAVGLLVVGWGAWLLAMFNIVPFGPAGILVAALGLAVAGWYVQRGSGWGSIRAAIQRSWPTWAAYELLFIVVLWAGLELRMRGQYGSAVQYTEKPMELMMLSSVLSSPTFPPQDFWLAGYSINYYYLGYVLVGVLTALSGVGLGVAFNLGVATIYALTALGVAGIIATLIGLRFPTPATPVRRVRPGTVATALLAILLVLGVGNQIGALQRIVGSSQVNLLGDAQRVHVLWQAIKGIVPRSVDPASVKGTAANNSSTLAPMDPANFDAWGPSRAIYDDVNKSATITVDGVPRDGIQQNEVITEFPFFSFYLGDMHPHVLALPFVLLVIALALALLMRPTLPTWWRTGDDRLELGLSGLMIGSLYMLNSWDAPTYGFLYAAALALLIRRLAPESGWRWLLRFGRQIGPVVLAALILFLPFLLTFDSFAGRDTVPAPFDKIPLISTLGRIIGPALDHSGWTDLLAIFGLFLIPLLAWALREVRGWLSWAAVAGALAIGLLLGMPALACAPLAFILGRAAWRSSDNPAQAFGLLLGGLGALLIFVTDVIYMRDIFDRRFNTVFKVYYQVWLLLAIVAAYSVWELLHSGRWRKLSTLVWVVPFGLFLAGSLVYPVSVLSAATTPSWDVPHELDGLIYSGNYPGGARQAADWIRRNSAPTARIVGAPGNSYGDGGEVATLSGRPTLLGWVGAHENFWRTKQPEAREQIGARIADIAKIYTSTDPVEVRALLDTYQIDFIVVGPNERKAYPVMSVGVLDQLAKRIDLPDNTDWILYQVTR
jgi:YYY domain-containing protein